MIWMIYALGGGVGHLTRAIALARAANCRGHTTRILTNSPYAVTMRGRCRRWLSASKARIDIIDHRAATPQVIEAVERWLSIHRWDRLIVDTFPRGIAGELRDFIPDCPRPAILIHRDLKPRYVEAKQLKSWVRCYHAVLLPGEAGPLATLPQVHQTRSWLVCSDWELLSRPQARRALGIEPADSRPAAVVVGCGRLDECAQTASWVPRLQGMVGRQALVRWVGLSTGRCGRNESVTTWPLLSLLHGVDLLVGAGGYNTVHEARATGTPLLAMLRSRLYDRQHRRLLAWEKADDVDDLLHQAANRLLRDPLPSHDRITRYENGTERAVKLIEQVGARRPAGSS